MYCSTNIRKCFLFSLGNLVLLLLLLLLFFSQLLFFQDPSKLCRKNLTTIRLTAHTNPSRNRSISNTIEKALLFLRLGLPSTLIRHENGALFLLSALAFTLIRHENEPFRKPSSNRTPAVGGKYFEHKAFKNAMTSGQLRNFTARVFLKYLYKSN